jgi:hypothetical protein
MTRIEIVLGVVAVVAAFAAPAVTDTPTERSWVKSTNACKCVYWLVGRRRHGVRSLSHDEKFHR